MDWLPTPYPDETFYSVLVRLHRYLGRPRFAAFARAVSGRRHFVALCQLPCDLQAVADHFGWSEQALDDLIRSTTTFSYHTAFASESVRARALQQMKGAGASLQLILGLATFPVPLPSTLQFCPECVAQMLSATGEAWWTRSHQLPAVLVCAEHGTWLRRSPVEISARTRHVLVSPEDAVDEAPVDQAHSSLSRQGRSRLIELAHLSQALLDHPPAPESPAGLHQQYWSMLADRDLLQGTAHLRAAKLRELLKRYWGDVLKQVPGLSITQEGTSDWITDLLRNRRRLAPPAQHLVLRQALGSLEPVKRPFGPPPWPCHNPLATHCGERVVTEHRLVRDRGKLHGHFTCSCGYSYSRTRQRDGTVGKPHLRAFGPTAAEFLRSADGAGLSLRGKARVMRVDPKTVLRIERELGR